MIAEIKNKITEIVRAGLIFGLVFGVCAIGFAQEEKKEDKGKAVKSSVVMKEVEGEVSAISKNFIAIVYQRDDTKGAEYEMAFPIDKNNIRLVHKQKLEDIQVGDTVNVQYEEVTEEDKEGQKQSRKAAVLTFLRPAVKKPAPAEPEPEEEEPMPLKGIEKGI